MTVLDQAPEILEGTPEEAATRHLLELMRQQASVTEEIRDQFSEHLELQRQILNLLMAERR